jgi:hypothetical protein
MLIISIKISKLLSMFISYSLLVLVFSLYQVIHLLHSYTLTLSHASSNSKPTKAHKHNQLHLLALDVT